jgi:hypothetical protein
MGLALINPPRISKEYFAQILQNANSPAAPAGAECYDIVRGYGLDPAIALAFFQHESSLGTAGVAVRSLNWGNIRKGSRAREIKEGFAFYSDWRDGLRDWCDLIRYTYIDQKGLDTVDKVVPVYAPPADGNVPTSYIAAVEGQVLDWSAADPYSGVEDVNLERLRDALLRANYERAGGKYHPDWAFHQYAEQQVLENPLGAPLGDSYRVHVGDKAYAIQVYALDTLYTPIATPESGTDWGVVKRMNDLDH